MTHPTGVIGDSLVSSGWLLGCSVFPSLLPSSVSKALPSHPPHLAPPRVRAPFVCYTQRPLIVIHQRFDALPQSYTQSCPTTLLYRSPFSARPTTTTSTPLTVPIPPRVPLSFSFSIPLIRSTATISIVALVLWPALTRATLA